MRALVPEKEKEKRFSGEKKLADPAELLFGNESKCIISKLIFYISPVGGILSELPQHNLSRITPNSPNITLAESRPTPTTTFSSGSQLHDEPAV
ncbi:hypothetical protein FTO70_05250 [Methanosarcina sp. KYL-1]|nr:hypothetical protein [Methanosarcina sp. KYL-1]